VKTFGLSKKDRLKSRKQIDLLFAQGKSFAVFPLRITFKAVASSSPGVQAGFSVSKRYFKKAVDRNRVKRLLREAYRLQKLELKEKTDHTGLSVDVFFLYTDANIQSYQAISSCMQTALQKLISKLKSNEDLS
jgi:ribonuclease P protein component